MPIERAQMRLKLTLPSKEAKKIKEKLKPLLSTIDSEEWDMDLELVRTWGPLNVTILLNCVIDLFVYFLHSEF